MMRNIVIPVIGALLLSMPLHAFAADNVDGTLNTDVWYLDTEVMINGNNLHGTVPSQAKLCFAPVADIEDRLCFSQSHPNITKWTESNITFVPPSNTPPMGIVVLVHPYDEQVCEKRYRKISCHVEHKRNVIEIQQYQAHPHIENIIDRVTGKTAEVLYTSREYEIAGYRFGSTGQGIYRGFELMPKTDIVRWTYDSIIFRPSATIMAQSVIQVHNGAGKGNEWLLKGEETALQTVHTRTRGTMQVQQNLTASVIANEPEDDIVSPEENNGPDDAKNEAMSFTDVDAQHPYTEAINWGVASGVVEGYPDGTFQPMRDVTRAEFIKMIVEAEQSLQMLPFESTTVFSDVSDSDWFSPYVRFAVAQSIATGYGDGSFRPQQTVNTAEALKIAYRFFQIPTLDPMGSEWYARYMEHAQENAVLFESTTDPSTAMSRQDALWIIWQLLDFRQRSGISIRAALR